MPAVTYHEYPKDHYPTVLIFIFLIHKIGLIKTNITHSALVPETNIIGQSISYTIKVGDDTIYIFNFGIS